MTGFLGQKFDFTAIDGQWYAVFSSPPSMQVNMRGKSTATGPNATSRLHKLKCPTKSTTSTLIP